MLHFHFHLGLSTSRVCIEWHIVGNVFLFNVYPLFTLTSRLLTF